MWKLRITLAGALIAGVAVGLAGMGGGETPGASKRPAAATTRAHDWPSPSYVHDRRIYLKMNQRAEELRRAVNSPRPNPERVAALKRELASLADQLGQLASNRVPVAGHAATMPDRRRRVSDASHALAVNPVEKGDEMNVMAIALVFLMAVAISAAMGVVMWGLILEARSNREWRDHNASSLT